MRLFKLKIRKFPSDITWFSFKQHIYESSNIVLDNIIISSIFSIMETVVVSLLAVFGLILTFPLVVVIFLYQCLRGIYKYIQYSLYLLSDVEEQRLQKHIKRIRDANN